MINKSLIGSSFETSLRVMLILDELSNFILDEQQLSCIDFIAIYGANFHILDNNLHGNSHLSYSEFSAKSQLVSNSIKLLVIKKYVELIIDDKGYVYKLSENGKQITSKFSNDYSNLYRIALREVLSTFPTLNSYQMKNFIYSTTIQSLED
ncbi:hypothetical protein GMA11_02540 [Granulicatella sp. zg-ZJ]|uniref:ABC-three component system middle component 2 n=1 Tax=Granulicatella sp. zg-ZJ TaxID=2678504 RepID=UPI0013D2F02A|nr:ABC-three component system middle component 2 [Granulicatella sp. zg-ZJ]NEW62265.1 hypothetical protein [Granulicatella sp. zg-ZJ]